jgi:hypothetical protein
LHKLVKCCPQTLASSGTNDVSVLPGLGADLKAEEASCSLDAVVEAEIRNSSRPGSQAPHAPPALTFGLPGKQSVKQGQAGGVLIRLLSSLARNRNIFTDATTSTSPAAPGGRLHYFCVRFSASAI